MFQALTYFALSLIALIVIAPLLKTRIAPWIGTVSRIADGDSVEARLWFTQRRIRLAGFDAPEWKQSYGREARTALVSCIEGRRVLFIPTDVDRYGRVVCMVITRRGPLSWRMVASGNAWSDSFMTSILSIIPRVFGRGLWADPARIHPSLWRSANPRR